MRLLVLAVLILLAGCAGEYSKVPEPTGEWVPANPPGVFQPSPTGVAAR